MRPYIQFTADWWNARTPREHILLWLMAGLLSAVLIWYGLIAPLQRAARDAESHHLLAVNNLASAEAGARIAKTSREAFVRLGETSIEGIVVRRARDAGLIIDAIATKEPEIVTISLAGVSSPAFFGWLEGLRRDDAIFATDVAIERSSSGLLNVDAAFMRGAP